MITFGAFSTPDWQRSTVNHYLHLIHPTGDGVSLDGSSLDSEGWESHAGFQYLEYALDDGYHEVSSTSAAFSALVSGLTTSCTGSPAHIGLAMPLSLRKPSGGCRVLTSTFPWTLVSTRYPIPTMTAGRSCG